MKPFGQAMKDYIRSGVSAPAAMRAAWRDVRAGKVARPAKAFGSRKQRTRGRPPRANLPARVPAYRGELLVHTPKGKQEIIESPTFLSKQDVRSWMARQGQRQDVRKAWLRSGLAMQRVNPRRRRSRAVFCSQRLAPPSAFDRRSFRTVVVKRHRVTVGCPRGQWDGRKCRVAMRAQRVLHPEGEGRCPVGGREIKRKRNPWEVSAPGFGTRRFSEGRAAGRKYRRLTREGKQATVRWVPRRRRKKRARANPAAETKIYDRVLAVVAERNGERYVHRLTTEAPILGTADGGLRIPPSRGRLAHPARVTIPGGKKIVIV